MNDYDIFVNYLFAKADNTSTPLSGTFELTQRCTLDCKMCYIHCRNDDKNALGLEKSAEWWIDRAREAKDSGTLLLLLTGGEPLIRNDFDRIYLECLKLGFMISINTNGTLISEERVRFFKANPPQRVNITLYGASEKTYERLCGSALSYKKAVSAVEMLTKAGIKVTVNYTLTKLNSDDMLTAQSMAQGLGLEFRVNSYTFPPVRAITRINNDDIRLSAEEAAMWHFKYMLSKLGRDNMLAAIEKFESGADVTEFDSCSDMPSGRINCRAGLSSYWITYDGFMTGCGMMSEPKIKADDFSSAWKYINDRCSRIMLSGECLGCPKRRVCDFCAASAYSETGRYSSKPTYACQKAEIYAKICKSFYNYEKKF